MNTRKIFFLIATLLLIACTKDNAASILELEYQLKAKNLEVDAFKSKNKHLNIELSSFRNRYKTVSQKCNDDKEIVLKKIDTLSHFSLSIIMNEKNLFNALLNVLISRSSSILDNIHMIGPSKFSFYKNLSSDVQYLNFLFINIDRSPTTIDRFFSEENKSYIYNFFQRTNYYKSTGLKDLIDALLVTYDELKNNEILRNQVHKLAIIDKETLQGEEYDDYLEKFKKVISSDVKRIVKVDKRYNRTPSRAKWAYTFWIRRQLEKNEDLTISLIREFKQNLDN